MRARSAPLPLSLLLAGLLGSAALAQPAPFDMSPERPASRPPAGGAPASPPPASPAPASPAPVSPGPAARPMRPVAPPAPAAAPSAASPSAGAPPMTLAPAPAAPARAPSPPAAVPEPASAGWKRHLIAGPELSMAGEIDRRRWSVYLTREEADAAATLRVGYQNAILVAPEASRLRVFVNDTRLLDEPVSSSSSVRDLQAPVPDGLLRPGLNTITVETELRHRTDCTVQSTYDLWTEIDSSRTVLEFAGAPQGFAPRRLDDLRAVGVDAKGQTRIRVLVPAGDAPDAAEPLLRLAQGLSLIAGMPNQRVEIVQGAVPAPQAGVLDVAAGPAGGLEAEGLVLPSGAAQGPSLGFVPQADGATRLVVTGAGWDDVRNGAERVVAFADRPDAPLRSAIANPALRSPDAPLVREGGSLSFRELGVPSQEFSGRRFRTEFAVAVPGDFFAESYGEALLRLDAAYSAEIQPGSQINVYVNGNIATTLPIGGGGSGILEAFPLKMTMRHLRPGTNTIALEANLLTAADEACLPGATASGTGRFALFDTSRIDIPAFARVARIPDLAAMQGTGFPYNRADQPVSVVLGDDRAAGLGTAASLLGRLSFVGGRAFPIEVSGSQAQASGGNAIFIGTPRQLPAGVLAQAKVDASQTALWGGQSASAEQPTGLTLERWREQFSATDGWHARLDRLVSWLRSTFDIEAGGLRFLPAEAEPFAPGPDATLLVGQGEAPTSGFVWTVVAAPTIGALEEGIGQLVQEPGWVQLAGQATTLDATTGRFVVKPVGNVNFLTTQPFSITNIRLIFANWLSENVLSYATLIVLVALMLGLSTTVFVRSLGQR